VAANYEEYTFKQLIFTVRLTVTDFVANNGQVGSIIVATQYNANDVPFSTKQDAMEYDGAISGKVSQNVMHGVECDPKLSSGSVGKFTRAGPAPAGEDIKTFDLGTLNVCVSNTPAQFNNQALGELWVSYTVELRKPKFFVTRGLSISRDVFVGRRPLLAATGVQMDALSYGQGQQNRIGGKLVKEWQGTALPGQPAQFPANPGHMYYVLPATFAGNIKMQCYISQASNQTGFTTAVPINFTALGSTVNAISVAITPYNDIFGNGVWSDKIIGPPLPPDAATPTFTQECYLEQHFSVITPTSANTATDNVIEIQAGASGNLLMDNVYVNVEVYNTGLSYPSQRLVIEDPTTGQVEAWP